MADPNPAKPSEEEEDDDAYISEEDADFAPEDGHVSSSSESEAEDGAAKVAKKAAPTVAKDRNDVGKIANDEVEGLMQDAGTKRTRADSAEAAVVQTRSMAASQNTSKKPLASVAGATIDVDAMWAAMSAAPLAPKYVAVPTPKPTPQKAKDQPIATAADDAKPEGEDLVEVSEQYEFAGEVHTRTKLVPRASLKVDTPSSQQQQKLSPTGTLLYRPLRRISAFEPNPQGIVRGLNRPGENSQARKDSKNKNKMPKHHHPIPRVKQPKKLNVVDKSKLDWQTHVDETGQREELEAAQKQKGAYLERRDFLERVEGREEERRAAAKPK